MSKRPRSRVIRGVKYTIKYLDPDHHKLQGEDGIIDLHTKEIFISKNPSVKFYTVAHCIEHECGHAVIHEAGIHDLDENFAHTIIEAFVDYNIKNK